MRILLAPDKFKGTLTAQEVCEAMTLGIHDVDDSIEVLSHPLADGGEGTSELLESALGLAKEYVQVNDPLFRSIETHYLFKGKTAFIEMANASGLQLLSQEERNPWYTSTFGTGELIKNALDKGANEIFLMIGGSATNDGGTGMAEALGYQFKAEYFPLSKMTGAALRLIDSVLPSEEDLIAGARFTVLTDVQNQLTGPKGAANIYGRQKGADDDMVMELDEGLKSLAGSLNNGFEKVPGAGAAGGLGYGAMSFLGASLKSGIQSVMEITGFEQRLTDVDLVITGEGKMDLQTVEGKVIAGVSEEAQEKGIPFGVICGMAEERGQVQEQIKAWRIYPLVNESVEPGEAMARSFELVRERALALTKEFLAR